MEMGAGSTRRGSSAEHEEMGFDGLGSRELPRDLDYGHPEYAHSDGLEVSRARSSRDLGSLSPEPGEVS